MIRTKNPLNQKNINMEQYDLREVMNNIAKANETPETKVRELYLDDDGINEWKERTVLKRGTEAMQSYRKTTYTYAQGVKYLEKKGYKLVTVVVPQNYEGDRYILRDEMLRNDTDDLLNEDVAKICSGVWSDSLAKRNPVEKTFIYCTKEDKKIFDDLVGNPEHGKKKYTEATWFRLMLKYLKSAMGL